MVVGESLVIADDASLTRGGAGDTGDHADAGLTAIDQIVDGGTGGGHVVRLQDVDANVGPGLIVGSGGQQRQTGLPSGIEVVGEGKVIKVTRMTRRPGRVGRNGGLSFPSRDSPVRLLEMSSKRSVSRHPGYRG